MKNALGEYSDSCGEARMELFDCIEVFCNQQAPTLDPRPDQFGRV